jgi:hypothetical protein
MAILALNRLHQYPFVWIFFVATSADVMFDLEPRRGEMSAFRVSFMALRAEYVLVLSFQRKLGIPVMVELQVLAAPAQRRMAGGAARAQFSPVRILMTVRAEVILHFKGFHI